MPTRFLPPLDSFDYEYLLYTCRVARLERQAEVTRQHHALFYWPLQRLAEAMAFLSDGTILRGLQLELY